MAAFSVYIMYTFAETKWRNKMDELGFDIGGLLSEEEAEKLFEEQDPPRKEEPEGIENEPAEEEDDDDDDGQTPEKVGEGETDTDEGKHAITQGSGGSSPNIYSSIASALKNDGIFPDFEDDELDGISSPEDFAELFEKAISSRLDERQKRIDEALGAGVAPDTVRMYEQTLQYLGSINDEVLSAETDEGNNLRRQLIYNDLTNRGYSHEKALKELEKSFKAGTDVDDAKDALESLNSFYNKGYKDIQDSAKKQAEERKAQYQKDNEEFKKMVLESEISLGDMKLDKTMRQRVYDSVTKPVYKDRETGQLLTAVQQMQKEKPLEFLKQLGMWYVLTDGGKNTDKLLKGTVQKEKNKAIKELGRKINSSSLNRDGSLRYVSGGSEDNDPLLSDGWQIGWNNQ